MTYELFLQTNTLNFLVVVGTLVLISKKIHLGTIIQNMSESIKQKVETSSKNAKDAIDEYKETKKSVKDAPQIYEQILNEAQKSAANLKQKIEQKTLMTQDELKTGLERIQKNQIEKYTKLTIGEIYQASIDLAIDETIVRLNTETHKRLVNQSIDELDKIEGSVF